MNEEEFIQALERYSQDRECSIPKEYFKEALQRIKDGKELVVAEAFRGMPFLKDAYDVALRLYKVSLN